ncbi:MAG: D-hexose-6-phosphate mutarotase [Phycisphaerae bacterium]
MSEQDFRTGKRRDRNYLNATYQPLGVQFVEGAGGLTKLVSTTDASQLEMYLHGAHLTHFQAAGRPILWMSERSWFEPGKPIRGGVPVCWPWFGPHPDNPDLPSHGFARLREWDVLGIENVPQQQTPGEPPQRVIELELRDDGETRRFWPGEFALKLTVVQGASLEIRLETTNLGDQPFEITEALHSYFAVSNVGDIRIEGLEGTPYIDKVDGDARKQQGDEAVTFDGEVDRPYLGTVSACTLVDEGLRRKIVVSKEGSRSTVVWNPHVAKAARMEDYGDEEWPGMVCIETANVHDDAVTVEPGARHAMAARIEAKAL